jgi:hypothetical protein
MSPDDHLLTNRKQSLIRSKQTPDPSVQFLVNMQTTDKFNADEQLRIGWPYANADWFQIRYDNYNGFKFDLMINNLFSRTTEAMVWKRDLYVHCKVLDRSCYFLSPSEIQNRCQRRSKFPLKPYVKQHFHGLLEKHWTEFNHTWQRCSLLCPTQVLFLFMPIC